jgi:hypothetical protein
MFCRLALPTPVGRWSRVTIRYPINQKKVAWYKILRISDRPRDLDVISSSGKMGTSPRLMQLSDLHRYISCCTCEEASRPTSHKKRNAATCRSAPTTSECAEVAISSGCGRASSTRIRAEFPLCTHQQSPPKDCQRCTNLIPASSGALPIRLRPRVSTGVIASRLRSNHRQ